MKIRPDSILSCLPAVFLFVASCGEREVYYEKNVVFPEGATIEQKISMASRLVPTEQQLAWQRMEMTAFLHFGINTFTDREWGDGTEDPALFNPTELDADQWIRTLKEGGFKMAVLTAKHHDGFCLWPTGTTSHSVASSPWKDGKGDVVREVREACDKYGIRFGVYLSPWDRNAECYGDSPAYNAFFIEQLTELLGNYGEVHEVWFDGACGEGPGGKKQEYAWDEFYATIKRLQPQAVMAVMGDDVRWVGNERGVGRVTEWSATVLAPGIYARSAESNSKVGVYAKAPDLGNRELIAKADEMFWYPSEVDVSIRPGWFYHSRQDSQVKSLADLADIYFRSVGYNSGLLLNIPPDMRGLIHETDAARLRELNAYLTETFNTCYLRGGKRLWRGSAGDSRTFKSDAGHPVNVLLLREDIARGQRVESFIVEMEEDGGWVKVAEGTTIGNKRLLRCPDFVSGRIRVTVTASRGEFRIAEVGAYYAGPLTDVETGTAVSDLRLAVIAPDGLESAADGDLNTVSSLGELAPVILDCGRETALYGFTYVPASGDDISGTAYRYDLEYSGDGKNWTSLVRDGEFSNIMHNPIAQTVRFGSPVQARFLRFRSEMEINNALKFSVAEFGVQTK